MFNGHGAAARQLVTLRETLEGLTERKARAAHAHVLQQAEVTDLVAHALRVELAGLLLVVGLDATDVGRLALVEPRHQ
jgi:hypothetical protein